MFLYILNIPKFDAIKIGIASSYNRIRQHMNTYKGINLKESYIVKAKSDSTIKYLEKQLLEDYYEFKINNKELKNKDGYTELRDVSILNNIIEDIEYKSERFDDKKIQIEKGIKFKNKVKEVKDGQKWEEIISEQKEQNEILSTTFIGYLEFIKEHVISFKRVGGIISEVWFKFKESRTDAFECNFVSENFKSYNSTSCIVKKQCRYEITDKDNKESFYLLCLKPNYYDEESTDEAFKDYFDEIQKQLQEIIKFK